MPLKIFISYNFFFLENSVTNGRRNISRFEKSFKIYNIFKNIEKVLFPFWYEKENFLLENFVER